MEIEPDRSLLIRALAAYGAVAGDPRAHGPAAVALVDETRRAGDREAHVAALRATAWYERSRLRNGRARVLLDGAARTARQAGLRRRLSEVLVTRAAINLELGRTRAAGRDLEAAAPDDGELPADVEFMRAVLLHNLGRLPEAGAAYRRVLADPGADVDNRGSSANNLALVAAAHGRFAEGLQHLDRATELAHEVGPSLHAYVAHNRGLVLAQAGRLGEAMRELDRATALFRAEEVPLGEHDAEYADVLAELRLLPEARRLAERAATDLEGYGVLLMAAEARLTLGRCALLEGDAAAAAEAAAAAAALFRRQRRSTWAARADVLLCAARSRDGAASPAVLAAARRAAAALDRAGTPAAAVFAHLTAGRLAEQLGRVPTATRHYGDAAARGARGPVLQRLLARVAAARAGRLAGDHTLVLRHCRAGLADLTRHREALPSSELRAFASGHGVELGELGLDVLLRAGSAARVLAWTERTRGAALLAVDAPVPDELSEERAALAALHAEVAEARRDSGVETASLLARQLAAEERMRRATWQRAGAAVAAHRVCGLPDVRRALGPRALVSYVRHGDRLVAVVVDGATARVVPLGPLAPLRHEADLLLFALRRLTRPGSGAVLAAARAGAEHALRRLRELAVEPVRLDPDRPLVVVPTGDTHRVPWSALHRGPVSVVPSASLWVAGVGVPRTGGGGVAVIAGPDLPGATAEADAVAACHPGARRVAPADATAATVLDALGSADLVHLACHGDLRADNAMFSALRMADGPLTVHELDLHAVAPRRIVLAACDSAAGTAFAGDEVLGFVGALLSRGTAGIVASVVPVGDAESVELMTALHRGLAAGAVMSDALHTARAGLDRTDPRDFVTWCGFAAYGAG